MAAILLTRPGAGWSPRFTHARVVADIFWLALLADKTPGSRTRGWWRDKLPACWQFEARPEVDPHDGTRQDLAATASGDRGDGLTRWPQACSWNWLREHQGWEGVAIPVREIVCTPKRDTISKAIWNKEKDLAGCQILPPGWRRSPKKKDKEIKNKREESAFAAGQHHSATEYR